MVMQRIVTPLVIQPLDANLSNDAPPASAHLHPPTNKPLSSADGFRCDVSNVDSGEFVFVEFCERILSCLFLEVDLTELVRKHKATARVGTVSWDGGRSISVKELRQTIPQLISATYDVRACSSLRKGGSPSTRYIDITCSNSFTVFT